MSGATPVPGSNGHRFTYGCDNCAVQSSTNNNLKGKKSTNILGPVLGFRSLPDNEYIQEAIWARSAAPELFQDDYAKAVWVRGAAPSASLDWITDTSGQAVWRRDDERWNV
ncbi:hypothetical protein MMC10_008252 [Thelotrema lepadinum]|nr:hypothetical protein [Thelotrema lepadinum]